MADALTVGGTVIAQSANTTAQVNGAWAGAGVGIKAGSITVGSNGSLNADAQGYVGSAPVRAALQPPRVRGALTVV